MKRPFLVSYNYTIYGDIEVYAEDEDEASDLAARKVARDCGEVSPGEVDIDGVEETDAPLVEFESEDSDEN